MNNIKNIYGFIGLLILFLLLSGFLVNKQVAPPLEEITPVTDNVHAVMENFVPARDGWNWIDVRLASLPGPVRHQWREYDR